MVRVAYSVKPLIWPYVSLGGSESSLRSVRTSTRAGPSCWKAVRSAPSSSPAFSTRAPNSPIAWAIPAKSGLSRSVPKVTIPAAFISSSTNDSAPLLNTTTFTGRCSCRRVISSPSSIATPPSPDSETTCRPGWLAWAPMACGSALAMDPWLNEPISRRLPFIRR
jgi:hypothetical protein